MTFDETQWQPDILGADFYSRTLPLGPDPDGEGEVAATLISFKPNEEGFSQRPALMWVHGMTDYFFLKDLAHSFHELGYAFYALDLRKCGRSHSQGQSWHYVSDLSFYFDDLNAALEAIENKAVVPIAHSTGALICALWLDEQRPEKVKGIILDGPWLDMMSIPRPVYSVLAPIIKTVGAIAPKLPFPGGNLTAYGDSLHVSRFGEWDYDLNLKPLGGHTKYVGWLRAIIKGFEKLHSGRVHLHIPILTLCSTKSYLGKPYSHNTDFADAVVDVQQTMYWAPRLGSQSTLRPLAGARHEVFASKEPIRSEAFKVSAQWLEQTVFKPQS